MLECLILGDSIARGIANIRKECNQLTEIGINSAQYNRKFGKSMIITELGTNTVIISLGSNDSDGIKTLLEAETLRNSIMSKDVIWILPSERKQAQREAIVSIAMRRNDRLLEIPSYSQDGIHPSVRGYDDLVKRTR